MSARYLSQIYCDNQIILCNTGMKHFTDYNRIKEILCEFNHTFHNILLNKSVLAKTKFFWTFVLCSNCQASGHMNVMGALNQQVLGTLISLHKYTHMQKHAHTAQLNQICKLIHTFKYMKFSVLLQAWPAHSQINWYSSTVPGELMFSSICI